MKVICFYLPQYHPIPENDLWWGTGFTDWRNVVKARPRFKGHGQPHIPADLGFYDLRLEETRLAQAALAEQYGISGFCYHHYWFNGRLLLERPFNEVLASGRPEFPFCLCWANENWTRRWDGREREILIAQRYEEYDANRHIECLDQAFRDPRYITIHGKPLFLVYRPDDLPNASEIVKAWRWAVERRGYPGIFLAAVETAFSRLAPTDTVKLGFDAIVEFQPNVLKLNLALHGRNGPAGIMRSLRRSFNTLRRSFNKLTDVLGFERIGQQEITLRYDYRSLVDADLARPKPAYTAFPCVMPSWDNTARRSVAQVIENDDPDLYARWLRGALQRVARYHREEQVVLINAWNEWAEGCHLEPDVRNGKRFLEATKRAIREHAAAAPAAL